MEFEVLDANDGPPGARESPVDFDVTTLVGLDLVVPSTGEAPGRVSGRMAVPPGGVDEHGDLASLPAEVGGAGHGSDVAAPSVEPGGPQRSAQGSGRVFLALGLA